MGGACIDFLGGVISVCTLMGTVESFPSDGQGHIRWCVLGVNKLGLTSDSWSAVFLSCWLFGMRHLAQKFSYVMIVLPFWKPKVFCKCSVDVL